MMQPFGSATINSGNGITIRVLCLVYVLLLNQFE